jgi:hypothetical protein
MDMDTEITKLIQALRGISNKLEEIYGKPRETQEINEEPKSQVQTLPDNTQVQELPVPATVSDTFAPQAFPAQQFDPIVPQGTFEAAPTNLQVVPQVETDAEKIKRLESELRQARNHNINFNFAPTAIGGTYGQGNY